MRQFPPHLHKFNLFFFPISSLLPSINYLFRGKNYTIKRGWAWGEGKIEADHTLSCGSRNELKITHFTNEKTEAPKGFLASLGKSKGNVQFSQIWGSCYYMTLQMVRMKLVPCRLLFSTNVWLFVGGPIVLIIKSF